MHEAVVRRKGMTWVVRCPECGTMFKLEGHPAPGGMIANIEFCPECGIDIEVAPPKKD